MSTVSIIQTEHPIDFKIILISEFRERSLLIDAYWNNHARKSITFACTAINRNMRGRVRPTLFSAEIIMVSVEVDMSKHLGQYIPQT